MKNSKKYLVTHREIKIHKKKLSNCRLCKNMKGTPVICSNSSSDILLIGQAPGIKEKVINKPFAWTAGKNLFSWFYKINVSEDNFRENVYMASICRCYPGKNLKSSGDRVPNVEEINNCKQWLDYEINILKPKLIIPVGKLAIEKFISFQKLHEVVGKKFTKQINGISLNIICLPHPSGISMWYKKNPGKALLEQSLFKINKTKVWQNLISQEK